MPRTRHCRRRRGLRIARLLAVLVCIAAIGDFGFNASQKNRDSSFNEPISGITLHGQDEGSYVGRDISKADLHLRFDAAVVVLAAAAMLVISVSLSKVSRRTKRLVLVATVVVVTLFVVCSFLLWMHSV